MKANLAQKEPEVLKGWEGLYEKLRQKSKKKPKFIVSFGPPYANGHIHIGHALSEVLKDIVKKTFQMQGYDATLVPGWDCHGLPIEWKVEEEYNAKGKKKEEIDVLEFRDTCRNFAAKWIDVQREEFKRLGIIADWDNPYSTMSFESEAAIVEQLGTFLLNGTLYKGLRPVFWSVVEETALAENETEYKEIKSPSIYVAFPVKGEEKLYAVIWTTTPWTIPANRAISYNPDISYCIVETETHSYIIAKECVKRFADACGFAKYKTKPIKKDLKNFICQHPFNGQGYDFDVPLLPGSHPTTEAGTGLVHTAPAYGEDDFKMGKEFNLEIADVINGKGIYHSDVPHFAGEHIFKVAPKVIDLLKEAGLLLSESTITHSYPHSWRSKKPLIFRATSQWFIDIDKTGIRKKALSEIRKVQWYPEAGETRISAMVKDRPDWCVSRQRYWGTPLTVFIHKKTKEPLRDEEVHKRIVKLIKEYGGDAWFAMPAEVFLGNKYNHEDYEKATDVLDVWFDSGCIHAIVEKTRKDLHWPADIYIEGSDQHRGWFQSSLLEAVGAYGHAPYKKVLTHGFVLDEKGYKMSKSLGNVVAPQEVIKEYGADVLRQWIVFSDYANDLRIGPEILKHQQEIYRKFRNTIRYLLGALSDFKGDLKGALTPYNAMPDLEKYMLHRLSKLQELYQESIENFDLRAFYSELHLFCTNDLSAFYFDVRKDTLYCDELTAPKRLAAQTVMHHTLHALLKWLAPVLSFTAEEAWKSFGKTTSIHEELTYPIPEEWDNETISKDWEELRRIRSIITTALEKLRQEKIIGSSLEAQVSLYGVSCDPELMNELTITSAMTVYFNKTPPENAFVVDGVGVVAQKADGIKCERCWKIYQKEKMKKQTCERCSKFPDKKSED